MLDELLSLDTSIIIVDSNYYSPFLGFELPVTPSFLKHNAPLYIQATLGMNDSIASVVESYPGKNVGLVDLESAFESLDDSGTPLPGNVEMICRTTYMCGNDETTIGFMELLTLIFIQTKKATAKLTRTTTKFIMICAAAIANRKLSCKSTGQILKKICMLKIFYLYSTDKIVSSETSFDVLHT